MAKGDSNDMVQRLRSVLPPSWFPDSGTAPVLVSLLNGVAAPLSWIYSLYLYVLLQMRIRTSTGVWIDRISYDYLGIRLPRMSSITAEGVVTWTESDGTYRQRVLDEIMRPRQTRFGILKALEDLTGQEAKIFEPWNPGDCGGYGIAMGYGCGGCYGSLALNNQFFVTAIRPMGAGVPTVGGYGQAGVLGYGVAGEYIDMSMVTAQVTDAEIYATAAHTKAAGMTGWEAIFSSMPVNPPDTGQFYITADEDDYTADNGTLTADTL